MRITRSDAYTKLKGVGRPALDVLSNHKFEIALVIIVIASSFVLFFHLGSFPILMWDESRLAVNAIEMLQNRDYVVTYYDGEPDLVSTKPPLMIWSIVALMNFLGPNEFSVRLPSAISALITVVILFLFCARHLNDLKAGVASSFALITSVGFIGEHVARTGDRDAMLVLWMVIFCLSYFIYLHADTGRKRHCYLTLTGAALALAILTKSVAGLMCLPALLFYTVWQKKIKGLLTSPSFYFASSAILVITSGYYLLRNYYNPGYIHAVINNELTGRYFNTIEGHYAPFGYYLEELIHFKFIPWIYLLPFCFVATQLSSKKNINRIGLYAMLYLVFYLLIISLAQTKLPWYDAPLYPIGSLLVGVGLSSASDAAPKFLQAYNRHIRLSILGLLSICILSLLYLKVAYSTIYKNHGILYEWSRPSNPQLKYGKYIKDLASAHPEIKRYFVVNNDYNAHLLFYVKAANLNGHSIRIIPSDQELHADDIVITCDPAIKEQLEQRYTMSVLHSSHSCYTIDVESYKYRNSGNRY